LNRVILTSFASNAAIFRAEDTKEQRGSPWFFQERSYADLPVPSADFKFVNLGYPPLNSATSLQGPSLLVKTLKKSATSPQQLRNIATSQQISY